MVEDQSKYILEGLTAVAKILGEPGGRDVTVIQVCCDESGKLADSKFVIFVGAVAEQDDWVVLAKDWRAALRDFGVRHVHTSDAVRCRGEFASCKGREGKRDELLEHLATLAHQRIACHYSFEMDSVKFRQLPQAEQKRLRDLPYCAFEGLIRAIAHDCVFRAMPISVPIDVDHDSD